MLYANGNETNDYTGLFKALSDIGVTDEVLAVAAEYLDLSKPMDNTLLRQITPVDMTARIGYQERELLGKFAEREILRPQNEELRDRYVLLCEAIAGNTCAGMIYGTALNQHHERALRCRYGAEADAVKLAFDMQVFSNAGWARLPECTDIRTLAAAMDHCIAAHPAAKLLLCAYILTIEPIPERKLLFKTKPSAEAQKAIAFVEECWRSIAGFRSDAKSILHLMTASAAASFFSEFAATQFHGNIKSHKINTAELAVRMPTQNAAVRILLSIAGNPCGNDAEFIQKVAMWTNPKNPALADGGVLGDLAKRYPETYRKALTQASENPSLAVVMEQVFRQAVPDYQGEQKDVRELAKAKCKKAICDDFTDCKEEVRAYLNGEITLESLLPLASKMETRKWYYNRKRVNYVAAFGVDDFVKRCICVQAMAVNGLSYYGHSTPGYEVKGNERGFVAILREEGMPFERIFKCAGELVEDAPDYSGIRVEMRDKFFLEFSKNPAEVAACELKPLNVTGRSLYLEILGKQPEAYRSEILSLADDGSKIIRAELAAYLKQHPEWIADVLALLTAKKAAKRELAAEVLTAFDIAAHREAVQAAFEAEKKADIKQKLAVLLGEEVPEEAAAETTADLIKDLTKGNKAKKLQWLFDTPFAAVRNADGTEADAAHLQAILLCYANMTVFSVSDMAKQLAALLNEADLAAFSLEVLGKWLEQGAPAKQKWVLHAAAQHGGYEAQTTLLHYIKDWSEHSRGAIAAEAVRAIAIKGTSEALMAVDQMARKFKNRQVRSAAADALAQAAEALHITTEELADRIVPNLGFDENLCREFDYGTRKFRVYLTPALELEIFEGEKKLKNLPKPGVKDDAEIAESSSKAFKEMKKQMKNVIAAQKQRLEYVLMCHRTWTAEGWQELFVKNPVMHCFAIGLIWGTYDADGALLDTFRYMEDGTFNTADEDEYELPEQAVIGLVHPIELAEDVLSAWTEQLADYEITQPFAQLSRPVFTVEEDEMKQTDSLRFADRKINNLSLLGRMTKYGWDKGTPQDAGFFYEFTRSDVIRREKDEKGNLRNVGNAAELTFSGTCVAVYESEDVTIDKVKFYRIGDNHPVVLSEVNARYFSEIMMQLSAALAVAAAEKEE